MNRPTLREITQITKLNLYGWHFPSRRPVFMGPNPHAAKRRMLEAGYHPDIAGRVITCHDISKISNRGGTPLYCSPDVLDKNKRFRREIEGIHIPELPPNYLDFVDIGDAVNITERALKLAYDNMYLLIEIEQTSKCKLIGCVPTLSTLVLASTSLEECQKTRAKFLEDLRVDVGWGKYHQFKPSIIFLPLSDIKNYDMVIPVTIQGSFVMAKKAKPYIGLGTEGQLMDPSKSDIKQPLPFLPILGMKEGRPYLDLSVLSEDKEIRTMQLSSFKSFKEEVEQEFGWTPYFRPLAQALRNTKKADLGCWPLAPHLQKIEDAFQALSQALCKGQKEI